MATIYCFTSTGNSLYAAKRIAGKIGGTVLPIGESPTLCQDDVIGLVFPVFFWGMPRIVARFATELKITQKDAYVFAIVTCGGPIRGVLALLKKRLEGSGITLSFGAMLRMVTNYLPGYKIYDNEARRQKTDGRLENIIEKIERRTIKRIGRFAPLNQLVYKLYPTPDSDRYFSLSPACTGCGTCQRICPVDNIIMEAGKPHFQHHCEHCLACLHSCPGRALDWKNNTQGKERYRNPMVTLEELLNYRR